MLTNAQKSLLKRAQRQAGLDDEDYREALETITGLRSSRDDRFTDRHLDRVMAYFEAIYWRGVDAGRLQPHCNRTAPFQQRGFWAARNTKEETSRDRYTHNQVTARIQALEGSLARLGFGAGYCAAIRNQVTRGRRDHRSLRAYQAALERTLRTKAGRE